MFNRLILIVVLALTSISCGGGGGDGSGGGSSRGVRIMHAGLDVAPLDLHSSLGSKALQSARFAEVVRYSGTSNGAQVLSLFRAGSTTNALGSVSLDYQGGRNSVLVYGSFSDGNPQINVLSDGSGEIPEGSGMVRVVNGVIDSGGIAAELSGRTTGEAELGSAGSYIEVPAGTYNFSIKESGGTIDLGVISISSGRAYSILATGKDNYFVSSSVFED